MKKIVLCCLTVSLVMMGCASQNVFLEVDKMSGTSFPPDFVTDTATSSTVTFDGLYDDGNLSLDMKKDDTSIPAEATVNNIRLHQLMTANRNPAYAETSNKWTTYLIVVKAYGPNPNVLGIMFDFNIADLDNLPREGSALFYDAFVDAGLTPLADWLFRVSLHEYGHSFNLHHTDWEGTSFSSGSTIMSYSPPSDVLWKLSDRSIEHLKRGSNHPSEYVKPRTGAKPFATMTQYHCDNHQSTPFESYTCESTATTVRQITQK